jgi:hypothetical protein
VEEAQELVFFDNSYLLTKKQKPRQGQCKGMNRKSEIDIVAILGGHRF